jgi:hypothetical protein
MILQEVARVHQHRQVLTVEAIAESCRPTPDERRIPVIVCSRILWFILVLSLLAVQACAVAERKEALYGGSRSARGSDVTGLWEGTAINGCGFVQMERTRCHAVVNIALTRTQQGSTVTGSYKCSMGTMMCRKSNDAGEIAYGVVREGGLSLRVMLPDGSSCIFQSKRSSNRMAGGYICLQGAAIVERGQWEVERIY